MTLECVQAREVDSFKTDLKRQVREKTTRSQDRGHMLVNALHFQLSEFVRLIFYKRRNFGSRSIIFI